MPAVSPEQHVGHQPVLVDAAVQRRGSGLVADQDGITVGVGLDMSRTGVRGQRVGLGMCRPEDRMLTMTVISVVHGWA
jgi:hypothetical protein